MNLPKYPVKKTLPIIFMFLIVIYVIWDVSVKITNYFRLQGYEVAVVEMVRQAENENCEPFTIFVGEKQVNLINIDCLRVADE